MSAVPARFAALRNRDCRYFLIGGMVSMAADNIEHVITYWVLWQHFHSSALVAFEVLSHWLPFLFFSVQAGALADRFDCRRVIQVGQLMFMAVSAAWAVLFATGSLTMWAACALLVVHGCAGTIWGPADQLMLHDFVGPGELASAVRLNATFRSLGLVIGPALGSVLLIGLGPAWGIAVNILFYLPLTLFLLVTRYTGHTRDESPRVRVSAWQALRVVQDVAGDRVLVSMIALAGLGSFFIGIAFQSVMPVFAADLNPAHSDNAYGVLLFALGAGGVVGGLVLEVAGRIPLTVRSAVVATLLFGGTTLWFATTGDYVLAVALLAIGSAANLAALSVTMTVVQLRAPADRRGRVIGLFNVSANGLRFGSGLTVGLFSGLVGVHWSLGLSSALLCAGAVLVGLYAVRGHAVRGPSDPAERHA
ncbi:MFS transporter [Spongisporangium articulatum]|uniref:MFS transporter n=1 Tax=Spongisporangium articulatum TaxID=3362603 RepID=A0ABW8ARR6_9ACTN